MKKINFLKIFWFSLVLVLLAGILLGGAGIKKSYAENNSNGDSSYGLDASAPEGIKNAGGGGGLPAIIGTVVGAALSFVGVLFLLLMIYGGIVWMTSQGNEQQVEKARNLIIAAIIGLIIVLAAYAITSFIGEQLIS